MSGVGCDRVLELSDLYLAGELSTRDREQVEAHLAMCAACRERDALDRRIRGAVRRHGRALAPSADLARRLEGAPWMFPSAHWTMGSGTSSPHLATPSGTSPTHLTMRFVGDAARRVARMRAMSIAAAVLVIVCAGGWRWGRQVGWSHARDMAHKHVFYLDQSSAGWVVSSPDRHVLEHWARGELGFAAALPDRTRDLMVLGVRVEDVAGTPALLAFFRDPSGQSASLFVMRAGDVGADELGRHLDIRGVDSAAGVIREPSAHGPLDVWVEVWREGDLRFALVHVSPDLVDAR